MATQNASKWSRRSLKEARICKDRSSCMTSGKINIASMSKRALNSTTNQSSIVAAVNADDLESI